ncbi:hypothetical protein A4G19_09015 [Pasteurellaceae bacterium Macca]|nr:hypothetical protein [Pasteurellaceae bacterium Macca]
MKRLLLAPILLLTATSSFASQYLCSYTAQISEMDKYNSSGTYLGKGYTKSTLAAILRQDRANYYVYGKRDAYDEADCVMHSKANRATFERLINSPYSRISKATIQQVVKQNPVIQVDIYNDYIEFKTLSANSGSVWK